jgi:hypothetical protein
MNFMDYLVDETKKPGILPEAAIMRLREVAKLYCEPHKFKVGDLVTPRSDGIKKGSGQPHLVIAVRENVPLFVDGDIGDSTFGAAPEIRILRVMNGDVLPYWMERGDLVPYEGDGA